MTIISRLLLFASMVLTSLACGSARPAVAARHRGQSDAEAARALASRLDSLRRAHRIPGMAFVVLRDTTVLLASGFGLADLERRIPVTPETPVNVASVAKPISAREQ